MSALPNVRLFLLAAITSLLISPALIAAENPSGKWPPPAPARDGSHDFDFIHGAWKATLKRLEKPLTGSTKWVEFEGRSVDRPLWGGQANIDEFTVDSPQAGTKILGLTLRLYNPQTRQWSLYWSNAKAGVMAMPATVGHFEDGIGRFYDEEDFNGKPIVVRYEWSKITANTAHFEQAFSADGGKSWEVNWTSDITREK
jgi:hypothetical protein